MGGMNDVWVGICLYFFLHVFPPDLLLLCQYLSLIFPFLPLPSPPLLFKFPLFQKSFLPPVKSSTTFFPLRRLFYSSSCHKQRGRNSSYISDLMTG